MEHNDHTNNFSLYMFHYMVLMSFVKSISNKQKPPNTLGINYHLQQKKRFIFLFEIMSNFTQKSWIAQKKKKKDK